MNPPSKRRTPLYLFASAGAAALVLAGCSAPAGTDDGADPSASAPSGDLCEGSAAVDLVDQVKDMSPEERESFLAEQAAATKGGAIDFYTEINDPDPIVEAFQDKYDGTTVNVYRAGSDQIRQRVLEESAAHFSGADLIEMDSLEMAILDEENLLAPATSSHADELSDAATAFDNFIGDRLSYIVPVWNTDLLPADQAPTSLEDLADARFKGKLALEGSDVYWFAGLVMYMEREEGKTEEEAVQVFKDIAANSAVTSGHTTTTELVVAGQYAIAANNYIHRAVELAGKGAPVGYLPVQVPVVAEITGVATACLSDNPAGALLLQDFILSEDGQQLFVEQDRTPANAELAAQTLNGQDVEPVEVDVEAIAHDYQKWSDLWDTVIREGNAG